MNGITRTYFPNVRARDRFMHENFMLCYNMLFFLPPQYVKGVDGQDDDTLDRVEKVTILVWKETRSDLGWRELDAEEEPPPERSGSMEKKRGQALLMRTVPDHNNELIHMCAL